MRKLMMVLVVCLVAGPALGEEVLYCTDTKSAGIIWDKKDREGEGRVSSFKGSRYIMTVISKTRRDIKHTTGGLKGAKKHLTCHAPFSFYPKLLVCSVVRGLNQSLQTWVFRGNRYTNAYLFGSVLGENFGDPNIWVAHGTCAKF